jgi:amino acid permease
MNEDWSNNFMMVLGFVNSMIGGSILILPVLGLSSGYISTPLLCAVMGFITFYTCWLLVVHVGKARNIKEGILSHFDQNYAVLTFYSCMVWMNVFPVLLIYFRLVVLQVQAIIG